jgi:NAD(P)-dependent dehydrogenase (short-subunit alcohol dehydrogenase family)/acyl carrier protein
MILADKHGIGDSLARLLKERGDSCSILSERTFAARRGNHDQSDPRLPQDVGAFRSAMGELVSKGAVPFRGVVHLWSLDAAPAEETTLHSLEADAQRGVGSALAVMGALADLEGLSSKPRLWLATRGAQAVGEADAKTPLIPLAIAQAPLWGLGQTFSVEHSPLWGGLVDLDPRSTPSLAARNLLDVLDADTAEDLIGFREGRPHVARLVPKHQSLQTAVRFAEDASYLVTGGLGGIGRVTAQWLVTRGAKHLVLLGRNMPPPREAWDDLPALSRWEQPIAAIRALEARGARVSFASVDVGDSESWTDFLASHEKAGSPPIRGVFHAAGTLHPKRLTELDMSEIQNAFRAKVAGAWNIHQSFEQRGLDFFVAFSSAPPHLGVLGQSLGAYNAANAFMDALAHHRKRRGLAALTINWGPWSEVGLHTVETSAKSNLERLASFGLHGISNQEGMEILGHLLSQQGETQSWVVPANWARLSQNDFLIAAKPFFSELTSSSAAAAEESTRVLRRRADFIANLQALTPRARRQQLLAHICERVAGVMGLKATRVDWRRGLFDMGMDSLMALELKTKLQNDVGISISATLAFDFPTVDAIAGHLERELFSKEESTPAPATVVAGPPNGASFTENQLDTFDEEELEKVLLEKLNTLAS